MGKKKNWSRRTVSVFTLKRTDTTLDLSQKAKRAKEERKKKNVEKGGREGIYTLRGGGVLADNFGRQFWPLANRIGLLLY